MASIAFSEREKYTQYTQSAEGVEQGLSELVQ